MAEDEPFEMFRRLPVELIEAMKTPQLQTWRGMCEIIHPESLQTLFWWCSELQENPRKLFEYKGFC
jgi:hypothetical protein